VRDGNDNRRDGKPTNLGTEVNEVPCGRDRQGTPDEEAGPCGGKKNACWVNASGSDLSGGTLKAVGGGS